MDKNPANHLFDSYLKSETAWKIEEMERSSYNQHMQENLWFEDYFFFFCSTLQLRLVRVLDREVMFFFFSELILVFTNHFYSIQ